MRRVLFTAVSCAVFVVLDSGLAHADEGSAKPTPPVSLGAGLEPYIAGVILAVTPKSETSSAMSFNYVVRSVGYSLGSAVGGLVLAAGTDTGHLFPNYGA